MDLIDQLDQTGIYGAGCKFAHFHAQLWNDC
jgi:hypothetical protein